jgi:phosphoribosyl-ATP pyrophosphohydrolase/phosphoribosyl-AMP cyclohydrolase/histidinol dehydrogenase
MTAVTARAAGVETVFVASPRPAAITLAAAHVAGADAFLPVGGAQAIAALAYGAGPLPACDVVVGPGNRFVTAAKHLVAADVGIDMLAGPSELVVVAEPSSDPDLVAADLIAQAEHDPDARVVLVCVATPSTEDDRLPIVAAILAALEQQLDELGKITASGARIARQALCQGGTVHCADFAAAASTCDALAPEHLALHGPAAEQMRGRLRHFGALFVGAGCAEVLGDYGAGPNHVLPTGGHARHTGGLSVATFLRLRTWMQGSADPELLADAAALARLEGLHGHARAALFRIGVGR